MAKRERKEKENKPQPKEKITVDFAFCDCGWQVSGLNVRGRAEAHNLLHRFKG